MIKRIVVAVDYSQFATYCRNRNFIREETGNYLGHPWHCDGLDPETPVHWLEGWSENPNVKASDITFLKDRFTTHKEISERRIYNEGIVF